jgi:hypothetical protein
MYLGFGAFLGFLPLYAQDIGLNDAAIAVVLAVQLTIALLAKPLTHRLGRGAGGRRIRTIGPAKAAIAALAA